MDKIKSIVQKRELWLKVSAAIVVLALLSILFRGLNFGIDFTGGSILHIEIGEEFTTEEVREIMQQHGLEDSVIQKSGDGGVEDEVIVRTVTLEEEERREIFAGFQERWPAITDEALLRSDTVGGVIGAELRQQALIALGLAVVAIVAYITYRFEFNFAIAAIAALVNDVFFVLLLFSILQFEIGAPFVAALLTIMGYSINDTIVIFDRIRENLGLYKDKGSEEVVTLSIHNTITRSINTSLTTLIVLGSLFIFGGITIRPFIAALLFGILSGTFSSIFVAPSAWLFLQKKVGLLKKKNLSPQESETQ